MSKLVNLDEDTFGKEIVDADNGVVVVDFWADWCGPCKVVAPILEEISEKVKTKICKVNVDKYPEIAGKFGIKSIPTMLVFRNGEKIDQIVGMRSRDELEELISSY